MDLFTQNPGLMILVVIIFLAMGMRNDHRKGGEHSDGSVFGWMFLFFFVGFLYLAAQGMFK